jgi:chemotaxis protein CheD
MVSKIFGGRAASDSKVPFNIGERNAQLAKQMMGEYGIPIVAENVAGEHGMNIRFDTSNGIVKLKYIKGTIR